MTEKLNEAVMQLDKPVPMNVKLLDEAESVEQNSAAPTNGELPPPQAVPMNRENKWLSLQETPVELGLLSRQELEKQDYEVIIPPDGGFGWLVALAGLLCLFCTWGCNGSFGVFLDHYLSVDTFHANDKEYALIGAVVICLGQLLAPLAAFSCRVFGTQPVMCVGIVLQTAAYLLASFAVSFWQIFMTQGVLAGLAFSLVFIPVSNAVPTWFTKKKATAMGIVIAGSGCGGLVFSLSIEKVIADTGDQKWALRMVCFVTLFCTAIGVMVLRPYKQPRKPFSETLTRDYCITTIRQTCDLSMFGKHMHLALLALWYSISLLGYAMTLYTLAPYATKEGYSHLQGSLLTALVNAAQMFGRAGVGFIADYCGRYNTTAAFNICVAIFVLVYWINAHTYGALVGFSIVLGLVIGGAPTMCVPLCHDLLEGTPLEPKTTAAWGGINVINSFFSLVSAVIALSLVRKNSSHPYMPLQLFTGFLYVCSFLLMVIIREHMVRKRFAHELASLPEDAHDERSHYEARLHNSIGGYFRRCLTPMKV